MHKTATYLVAFTIVYNLLEGVLSVDQGFEDESLTVLGFGIDSFIEVMARVGVAHTPYRIKMQPHSNRGQFERTALRVPLWAIMLSGILVISYLKELFYSRLRLTGIIRAQRFGRL